MKKRLLFFGVIGLVSFTVILLKENIMLKSKINIGTDNVEKVKRKDMLSMMLETDAGSGNYELTTRDSWPTEGYIFNSTLSKCENGGKLSWDDENKRVLMSGNVTDKCYIYFDIDNKITLANYIISQFNGVQGNNNIYYHDNSLENGAGDNSYRYAGSGETTNNFVCFGSDANTCTEDYLYRIIGVFDGKVKIIKATAASSSLLGTDDASGYKSGFNNLYYWSTLKTCPSNITGYITDSSSNVSFVLNRKNILAAGDAGVDNFCNLWKYSTLNTVNLNTNFLTNIGTKWAGMIEDAIWKIGGYNTDSIIASVMYDVEVKRASETYGPSDGTSKIGLIYVSDFGFAASPSAWTTSMNDYKAANTVNWLSQISSWTLTKNESNSTDVFSVDNGNLYYTGNVAGTGQRKEVYPVFYLLSSVTYSSGDGTKDSPIRIN